MERNRDKIKEVHLVIIKNTNKLIMVDIKFKILRDNAIIPRKSYSTSGCYDVYAAKIETPEADNDYNYVCYLGFATAIPKEYKGVIVPRSSITKSGLILQNSPAQIDSDYRGEWLIKFKKLPESLTILDISKAVAQIYFEKVIDCQFFIVDKLSNTYREIDGFGSTDIKNI